MMLKVMEKCIHRRPELIKEEKQEIRGNNNNLERVKKAEVRNILKSLILKKLFACHC